MKKNYFAKNLTQSFLTLCFISCVLFASSAFAQKNIGWTGATNNNWFTPTNWNYPAITSVATFAGLPEISPIVIFSASSNTLTLNGNVASNGNAASNIPVGARVSGAGIAPNTTVTEVAAYNTDAKTTQITLSTATIGSSDAAGTRLVFQYNTKITLKDANEDIAVGDGVAGYGIPVGAKIHEIDATKKIITITGNTLAGVGTPGTNVVFTFATPKPASGAPTILDIALISNGAKPVLAAGSYYLGGLTITNGSGAITGSTLSIPADVEVFVESLTNEAVLIKGGNIINDGYLDIKNGLTGGSANTAGGYGITFGLPERVPTTPTEYLYSGSGTLKIDTSAGNQFSGGILFNGAGANAANATYKLLFNGTTTFVLSTVKNATNGSASTHAMRAVGISALQACKVIIGGAGFDLGDSLAGGANGLLATSGGGVNITIAPETTINVFTNTGNPMAVLGMYSFGSTSIPSFITNKGTINMSGTMVRSSPISLSAQNEATVNLVNDGTLNVGINPAGSGSAGISVTNNGGATLPAFVNVINNGLMTVKTLLNGVAWGAPIVMTTFAGAPNLHVNNSGTLNLIGSNHSFGARVFNPALNPPAVTDPPTAPQTGASRITNSGTINTNQELRTFYTINTSTGTINFAPTNDSTLKLTTFTVPTASAATIGATYRDSNSNIHTVLAAKVAATGTTLVTSVAANAINPPVVGYAAGPPEVLASALTKTGGAGDDSIVFTALVSNGNNALFQTTLNSGTINTNAGIGSMTGINGVTTPDATSVISLGGDTKNSLATFGEITGDAYTLRGTLKMQGSGNTVAGIDYDAIRFTGGFDYIDISAATLDLTGIYIPTEKLTIDIITTFVDPDPTATPETNKSGAILGKFEKVIAPKGWTVNVTEGLGSKVQLIFDPALTKAEFAQAKFSYYPNPTKNQINVSAAKNINKVELYNVLGQKVLTNMVNATQKQVDVSNLQKGVYLMEVTIESTKQTFKIIKD